MTATWQAAQTMMITVLRLFTTTERTVVYYAKFEPSSSRTVRVQMPNYWPIQKLDCAQSGPGSGPSSPRLEIDLSGGVWLGDIFRARIGHSLR